MRTISYHPPPAGPVPDRPAALARAQMARRDARPAGPADPGERRTAAVPVRRAHPDPARDADPVHDELAVTSLVGRARNGDKQAWDTLVERYAPLIWSICRRHRLGGADADDVGQNVWLALVDQLDKIRDPAALPGWLATTTRRECVRVLRAAREPDAAGHVLDAGNIPDQQATTAEQALLVAERHAAVREAFLELPPHCQRLITLLIEDPPLPYTEISARLGIAVGSIGPIRGRCLDKIRRHPAITALINTGTGTATGQLPGRKGPQ
jgi:RNA polymerase sigma factor (sigma-70 family)